MKLMFRNRIAVFVSIAVPLLLTYLFSLSQGSSQVSLYVADLDHSVYSNQLINNLEQHTLLKIVPTDEATINKKVDDQDISFGLVVDKGFSSHFLAGYSSPSDPLGSSLPIHFVQNVENGEGTILEEIITGEVSTIQKVLNDSHLMAAGLGEERSDIITSAFKGINEESNLKIDAQSLTQGQNHRDQTTARLIGFLVMFLWFAVVQGLRTFIDERENNTLTRLLSTPVDYKKYVLAKMTATYLFAALHVVVILLAGKYLLKISLADNLFAIIILFAAYLFALTCITMMMIPFMKNQKQFTSSASIFIVVTGMLGGSFFSMEMAPQFMQVVSKFTPQSWAIKSLLSLTFDHQSIYTQWASIGVFLLIGLIGLVVGFQFMNRQLKVIKG